MFGIRGDRGWENQFHCHDPSMNDTLIELVSKMMQLSLEFYIEATIKKKL